MKKNIEENIISILGVEALPDEKKAEIVSNATTLVEKNTLVRILELIPKDQVEKFNDIDLNSPPEDLISLLEQNNIDVLEIIREEIIKVKEDLAEVINLIKSR